MRSAKIHTDVTIHPFHKLSTKIIMMTIVTSNKTLPMESFCFEFKKIADLCNCCGRPRCCQMNKHGNALSSIVAKVEGLLFLSIR